MKKFENIKILEFLVIFELIFENVNIGLNLGMTKRTFKMYFFKSSDVFRCICLILIMQDQMIVLFLVNDK